MSSPFTGFFIGFGLQPVRVTCYSGHTYADRPTALVWEGEELGVREVEREWQEPGERHFQVLTRGGRRFRLCYDEGEDRWSACEVIPA